jgi:hypothetical protein
LKTCANFFLLPSGFTAPLTVASSDSVKLMCVPGCLQLLVFLVQSVPGFAFSPLIFGGVLSFGSITTTLPDIPTPPRVPCCEQ